MKTTSLKLSALASALLLAGCGGGGSSSTDIANTTSKITGTVPGTLIEAFCEDGSYYQVKSTENDTDKHPFEIEVPNTLSCSLVMTTNENNETTRVITQIGIITPDANGTLFTAASDIDLGHIPLAMDPSDSDADGDHVSDDILNIQVADTSIVIELENPLDDDDDGLVNVYEDDDNDNISNYYDDDDDGDGEDDSQDYDNDGDEIDGNDNDLDGDGIDNDDDVDDDNDGERDDEDSDDDNDGLDDYLDSDDDNDGIDDDEEDSSNTTTNIILPTNYTVNAGRLLGSQCAQCHGTNGVSSNEWDSIAGEDNLADEIFEDDEPIMSAQAHGYTSEEIVLIGNWLKTLNTND
ncbi:MAG: hypothetical protein HKP62_05035 [Sulfurovum sp.]|nr:hypothetical protein [Sulfurovum sp.]NNJ45361.1 hypothetical protein [Sulfurovum sp.]